MKKIMLAGVVGAALMAIAPATIQPVVRLSQSGKCASDRKAGLKSLAL